MDIINEIKEWKNLSSLHTIKSEDTEEGYFAYFMKDGVEMGYFEVKNNIMFYDIPEELMERV